MNRFSIPHDALVFVGDGQKALFLRNAGDATLVNLTTERVFTDENPPTHDQGTDRPGRVSQSAAKNKRSGVETTDWHELEKERFAKRVASALEQLVRAGRIGHDEEIVVFNTGAAQKYPEAVKLELPRLDKNRTIDYDRLVYV